MGSVLAPDIFLALWIIAIHIHVLSSNRACWLASLEIVVHSRFSLRCFLKKLDVEQLRRIPDVPLIRACRKSMPISSMRI